MQNEIMGTKKLDINALLGNEPEALVAIQVLSGNTFKADKEDRIIKIEGINPLLVNTHQLQELIWNKNVEVKKLYVDRNNYIVSEVSLNDKPLKEMLT